MRKHKSNFTENHYRYLFSFLRPLLEYADVVWDNCTQYEANVLEIIQHKATRIICGDTK